ncbi:MAG: 2-dehydropantoate 2-reductase [Candidatus Micrarchaeota archaeon]|nr:2-dehydropantoate 2-reductase [Candidatus Micrarchaeota archaeon]
MEYVVAGTQGDPVINKIFILGAGAIGSSCGVRLHKKNDVTLIGEKKHVDSINEKGLSVQGEIKGVFRIKADTQIREIPPNSLVVLTTKVYDSEKAIEGIVKLLRKDTTILILQNGIGNEEIVKSVVGERCHVQRGVIHFGAEFLKPGEVNIMKGWIVLGNTEKGTEIAKLFNESGLETRVVADLRKDIWKKLIINCVINPLTAILQIKDYEIVVPSLERVRRGVVEECLEVARAEGVQLERGLMEATDREISGLENYSSMHQDLMKGRRTEIDFLNGKIVEFGRKYGIPTPINESLVSMIKFLEEKNARGVQGK